MWVKFTETFRWRPANNVVIRYQPGMRLNVTRRCAAAAVAKGAAVRSSKPKPQEETDDGKATDSE